MNSAKGWQWLCVGLLAAACSLATTGCSDDGDDEGAVPGTTTVVVTNTVNGVTHTNTVVVTNAPAATPAPTPAPTPAATEQVLLDIGQGVDGGEGFGVMTAATPAAGTVTVYADWVAVDVMVEPQPVTIPLRIVLNDGFVVNNSATSPWHGGISSVPASTKVKIQVYNDDADTTTATVHLRAVWTPD